VKCKFDDECRLKKKGEVKPSIGGAGEIKTGAKRRKGGI